MVWNDYIRLKKEYTEAIAKVTPTQKKLFWNYYQRLNKAYAEAVAKIYCQGDTSKLSLP